MRRLKTTGSLLIGLVIGAVAMTTLDNHGIAEETGPFPSNDPSHTTTAPPYQPPLPSSSAMIGEDGASMQLILAGNFTMGSLDGNEDELPMHSVYLDSFYLDTYEVPLPCMQNSCAMRHALNRPDGTKCVRTETGIGRSSACIGMMQTPTAGTSTNASRRKQSGKRLRGARMDASSPGAMMGRRTSSRISISAAVGTATRPSQPLAACRLGRVRMASTIWAVMSGNGSRIGTMRITTRIVPQKIQRGLRMDAGKCSGVDLGTLMRTIFAPRSGTDKTQTCALTISGSGALKTRPRSSAHLATLLL